MHFSCKISDHTKTLIYMKIVRHDLELPKTKVCIYPVCHWWLFWIWHIPRIWCCLATSYLWRLPTTLGIFSFLLNPQKHQKLQRYGLAPRHSFSHISCPRRSEFFSGIFWATQDLHHYLYYSGMFFCSNPFLLFCGQQEGKRYEQCQQKCKYKYSVLTPDCYFLIFEKLFKKPPTKTTFLCAWTFSMFYR